MATKRQRLLNQGFHLINTTLSEVMHSFQESLEEMGRKELIPFLPWSKKTPKKLTLNRKN